LDIDHFKAVNDRRGHRAGDQVLCDAVQNILDATRGIDVVGRWGGEEFAILLPHVDAAAAHIVAERIRLNVQRASPSNDRSRHTPITVSLGLTLRRPTDTIEEIVARADAALYRAKSLGRNCVVGEQLVTSKVDLGGGSERLKVPAGNSPLQSSPEEGGVRRSCDVSRQSVSDRI
jgi:diguanylate cyclase (GGDEF)-like protein